MYPSYIHVPSFLFIYLAIIIIFFKILDTKRQYNSYLCALRDRKLEIVDKVSLKSYSKHDHFTYYN